MHVFDNADQVGKVAPLHTYYLREFTVSGGNADEILIMERKSKKTHVFKTSNALDAQEWISAMKSVVGVSKAAPAMVQGDSAQAIEGGEPTKSADPLTFDNGESAEEAVAAMSKEAQEAEQNVEDRDETMASVVQNKKNASKFGSLFRRKKKDFEIEDVEE
jgi:hypothetical protein